jgi:hypothetical protein
MTTLGTASEVEAKAKAKAGDGAQLIDASRSKEKIRYCLIIRRPPRMNYSLSVNEPA